MVKPRAYSELILSRQAARPDGTTFHILYGESLACIDAANAVWKSGSSGAYWSRLYQRPQIR